MTQWGAVICWLVTDNNRNGPDVCKRMEECRTPSVLCLYFDLSKQKGTKGLNWRLCSSSLDIRMWSLCMHWPTCPMKTTLMCSFLGASGCVGGTLGTGASSSSSIISGAVSSVAAWTAGPRSPPPGSSSFGSASFWSHGSSVLISVSPFSTGAALSAQP